MKKLMIVMMMVLFVSTAFGAQIVKDSEFILPVWDDTVWPPDYPDTVLYYGNWIFLQTWGFGFTGDKVILSGYGTDYDPGPPEVASWASASIWQDTGEVFQADTVYTMTARWYDGPENDPVNPDIEDVHAQILSIDGDPSDPCSWADVMDVPDYMAPALEVWQDLIFTFDTASDPCVVGKNIGVGFRLTTAAGTWVHIDSITLTYPSASDPDPADETTVDPTLTELSWTWPPNPVGNLTSQVYLGDPNFLFATLLPDANNTNNFVAVSLQNGHTYEWRVDVTDSGTGKTIIGPVWGFNTINAAPVVDAGLNQSAWLSGGSASADLSGVISDDGIPEVPGTVAYTWSMQSGPAPLTGNTDPAGTVPNDPCDHEVSTTVSFNTAGTYVIKLDGSDSVLASSDTVTVYVYAAGDLGLIAHWPLDTDYNDTEAGAHHGTPAGDAAIDPNAQVGAGSVRLDGDDYVNVGGGTTDPNFPTWASPTDNTKMSVSCWIKSDDLGSAWAGVVSKGDTSWKIQQNDTSDDVMLAINNVAWAMSDGGSALDSLTDGKWHHIVGVYMTDASYIYIDGIPGGTGLWTSEDPPEHGGEELWIGSHPDYASGLVGYIDDVKLFQAPLNGDMVLQEFIAGGGKNSCGGVYAATDINEDCHHDLKDVAALAAVWLECTDVTDPACD